MNKERVTDVDNSVKMTKVYVCVCVCVFILGGRREENEKVVLWMSSMVVLQAVLKK